MEKRVVAVGGRRAWQMGQSSSACVVLFASDNGVGRKGLMKRKVNARAFGYHADPVRSWTAIGEVRYSGLCIPFQPQRHPRGTACPSPAIKTPFSLELALGVWQNTILFMQPSNPRFSPAQSDTLKPLVPSHYRHQPPRSVASLKWRSYESSFHRQSRFEYVVEASTDLQGGISACNSVPTIVVDPTDDPWRVACDNGERRHVLEGLH